MTHRLIDATTGLTGVIAEVDRDATRCSPSRCVGAKRVLRLPGVLDVRIGARTARVLRKDGWHRYDLHSDTAAAVHAYDAAGEVMPAGFRFRLVPPGKKLQSRASEKPGSDRRSGKRESVATRRPSTRSLFVDPPQKPVT
jgi:hypothetical protein